MTPEEFRDLFPALRSTVWLDTPGSPPGAGPVVDALRNTVSAWSSGEFDWQNWDSAAEDARQLFARFIGVEPGTVSAVGSLAEAAATVAGSLPRGRVVVAEDDFRSNLFPWLARHDVVAVPTDRLADALDRDTALLAVSEVTTKDGRRLDLRALRAATDAVGTRLFVNLTQSLGALHLDPLIRPDYLAVHGYKWLLCPRGAAWLVTRPDRMAELAPLAPNWKSTPPAHAYFGGPMHLADDAARCDASPAWFSWVGACAALRLIGSLDPARVERHCLGLARCFAEGAQALGFRLAAEPSHIVVLYARQPDRVASRWAEHGIRATAGPDRVRFGFHYFNSEADVTTALTALGAAR